MKVYLQIIQFNFLKFLTYPTEIISAVLDKMISIGMLILLWDIVGRESGNAIDTQSLISYFFISSSISTLVMSYDTYLGKFLRHQIKYGFITQTLVKPINIVFFSYATTIGERGLNVIMAIILLVAGFIIMPEKSLTGILLFIPFFIFALSIGFAMNLFEGALGFVFVEVNGIKNAIRHISRLLSGKWIPLFYFPVAARSIVELLPFQGMVYGPTIALSQTAIDEEVIKLFIVSLFWAILLNILVYLFWKRTIKLYEAIGQ